MSLLNLKWLTSMDARLGVGQKTTRTCTKCRGGPAGVARQRGGPMRPGSSAQTRLLVEERRQGEETVQLHKPDTVTPA
jgi:hypothetical protein